MEKLIFNNKTYIVANNVNGRRTLFDDSGKDVLSKEIDSWWTEWQLSHKVGFDILRVNKGPLAKNYIVDIDGKLTYLFDEWFLSCKQDVGLSCRLKEYVVVIEDLNGGMNFAILEDKKVKYLLDMWYDGAGYDLTASNALKKPTIMVELDAKYNFVVLDQDKQNYLFEDWSDSIRSLEDAMEQKLGNKQ